MVVGPSYHHTSWITQHFASPPPDGSENFPVFIRPPALSRRGAMCPEALLDYADFSRADGAVCLPGMVAFFVSAALITGRCSQRFCVHESWWVQENPGTFRTCYAVLCTDFLLFEKRKKERSKKQKLERLLFNRLVKQCPTGPQCLGVQGYFVL
jgi:hypothetical protein